MIQKKKFAVFESQRAILGFLVKKNLWYLYYHQHSLVSFMVFALKRITEPWSVQVI